MDRLSTLTLDRQRVKIPASHLRRAYETQRAMFQAQPQVVQRFLESQAQALARALVQGAIQVRFSLPAEVMCKDSNPGAMYSIPIQPREQHVSRIVSLFRRQNLQAALGERLTTLDSSTDPGVATCAALIRYTTATAMVRSLLPSGRFVIYKAEAGEEIPNQPVVDEMETTTRAIATGDDIQDEQELDNGMVAYNPEARRFYLPQWVAFDEHGRLLVNTLSEARAHIASMQSFMRILRFAADLAPYILADTEYQRKRYGMMGQLVNQGRLLARYETNEIIQAIWQRVKSNKLNRGVSLSLPYFDDKEMEVRNLDFVGIPAGRIMFIPAFLVLAVCEAQAKVTRNDQMSPSTRQHLLAELKALEKAFDTGDSSLGA